MTKTIESLLPPGTDKTTIKAPFGVLEITREPAPEGEEWKPARYVMSGHATVNFACWIGGGEEAMGDPVVAEAMLRCFSRWLRNGHAAARISGIDLGELGE